MPHGGSIAHQRNAYLMSVPYLWPSREWHAWLLPLERPSSARLDHPKYRCARLMTEFVQAGLPDAADRARKEQITFNEVSCVGSAELGLALAPSQRISG